MQKSDTMILKNYADKVILSVIADLLERSLYLSPERFGHVVDFALHLFCYHLSQGFAKQICIPDLIASLFKLASKGVCKFCLLAFRTHQR